MSSISSSSASDGEVSRGEAGEVHEAGCRGWLFWTSGVLGVYWQYANAFGVFGVPKEFHWTVCVACLASIALVLWVLWRRSGGGHSMDECEGHLHPVEEAAPIKVTSRQTSILSTIAIGGYFLALALGANDKVMRVAWQICVTGCLCSTLHLSLVVIALRGAPGALPLAVYLLLLPLCTHDRFPFSWTQGCPPSIDFAMCILGLLCAMLLYGRRDLVLRQLREPVPGWHPEAGVHRISVVFEWFPLLAAGLSIGYWLACLAVHYKEVPKWLTHPFYHCCWSYLRPCYAITFALYWSKRMPDLCWLQAVLCGAGVIDFAALATMAETSMTHGANAVCSTGGDLVSPALTYAQDMIGKMGHRLESQGFYSSMLLFVLVGLTSGKWMRSGGRRLELWMTVPMLVCWSLAAVLRYKMSYLLAGHHHWHTSGPTTFATYLGLWVVLIGEAYLICCGCRLRLVIDAASADRAPEALAQCAE